MSGTTPKLGLTIPDINDEIPAWPGIAAQGLLDLEDLLIIDAKTAAEPADSYPIGQSMFNITTNFADSGGWPSGSGMVISFRRQLADITFQMKVSQGVARAPDVFIRTGGPSYGWSPWAKAGSRDLPWAVASGTVLVSDVTQGTNKSATVSLPSGAFSANPTVTLTPQVSNPAAFGVCLSAAPSKTSFQLTVARLISGTASIVVHWHAIQGEVV